MHTRKSRPTLAQTAHLLRSWLVAVALMLCGNAHAGPYSNIYVFGDSLSDSGNVFAFTTTLSAFVPVVPGAPGYWDGRFSNGPNYADYLSSLLGLTLSPSIGGGDNYAFGGARTDSSASPFLPSLAQEVSLFASDHPVADPAALYVVFAGADDVRDAASGGGTTEAETAASNVVNVVAELGAAGARNILVPNLPDVGLTPELLHDPDPAKSSFASQLTVDFNAQLGHGLAALTGMHIVPFDTYALFSAVTNDPSTFSLGNIRDACYTNDPDYLGSGTACTEPGGYLFWDEIHPTTAGHAILASAMYAAAVPEPLQLTLFAVGFIIVLARHRRHFAHGRQA